MKSTRSTLNSNTQVTPINRILLRREEAARAMGMSVDHFDRRVRPEVESVKLGRITLYAPEDLRAWVTSHKEPSPIERLGS